MRPSECEFAWWRDSRYKYDNEVWKTVCQRLLDIERKVSLASVFIDTCVGKGLRVGHIDTPRLMTEG